MLNLALTTPVRWNMFAHFRRRSRVLPFIFPLLPLPAFPFFSIIPTAPPLPLSFFFILNTLREEMLLHARSRGEDVPLTAYTNPGLPQRPGELFPFRFPIPLHLPLSKRVRAAAAIRKGRVAVSGINFRNNERCLIYSFPISSRTSATRLSKDRGNLIFYFVFCNTDSANDITYVYATHDIQSKIPLLNSIVKFDHVHY